MTQHIVPATDPRRDEGLVHLDAARATGPACHVLVIGVGAYRSGEYPALLDTATISARAVADWFLGGSGAAGFAHPGRGLGSLAVLLSENAGAGRATFAGGEVPRATFAEARLAVRSWLRRIESHKDNLAVVYVAGHGESFLSRTAFLLEDYGTDRDDATAGMAEVEQLLGSLENAVPVSQLLLFDCCRNPRATPLPWGSQAGTNLISLTKRPGDHGEPRQQWAICATSLGDYATGLTGERTLFNRALLDALDGVAGDPSSAGWPIRPGLLFDKLDRILSLHRLPDERPQRPSGRMAGSYEICFAGEREELPVYVGVADPADFADTTFIVSIDGVERERFLGQEGEAPFRKLLAMEGERIRVEAERNGAAIGAEEQKLRAPALFIEIARRPQTVLAGSLAPGRSLLPMARIDVVFDSPARLCNGAVVEIVTRGDPAKNPKRAIIGTDGATSIEVAPGEFSVTLRTPDGATTSRDVAVAADEVLQVRFAQPPSPHEWLQTAAALGAVKDPAGVEDAPRAPPPVLRRARESIPDKIKSILFGMVGSLGGRAETVSLPAPAPARLTKTGLGFVGRIDMNLGQHKASDLSLAAGEDDGRLMRFDIVADGREAGNYRDDHPMVFAEVFAAGRRELAVVPCVRPLDRHRLTWSPHLVVDRMAPVGSPAVTAVVEDMEWASLLGFLGARDFASADALLESGMGKAAIHAMEDKVANPLAAAAGALVAVATSAPDRIEDWDPWLENLANWFPGLPDGAIILGRRLLSRARAQEQIAAARSWLVKGFARGPAVYSLSVDWLARGLESCPDDDEDFKRMQAVARRLANRVDSRSVFTVIRADL